MALYLCGKCDKTLTEDMVKAKLVNVPAAFCGSLPCGPFGELVTVGVNGHKPTAAEAFK